MKYKAFISYKHSGLSELHATFLEKYLRTYAKRTLQPPLKIFRDEQQLKIGENLPERIKEALNSSDYLIYLASNEASESFWVRDELLYWCKSLKKADKLIIILIDGKIDFDIKNKKIDWENTTSIPNILKDYVDSIPLYADFRNFINESNITLQNIEYKNIINNISARLRGITPEEMNGEEIKIYKKNRFLRNAVIVIISVLGVISLITSIFAIYQRNIAINQRNKSNSLYLTKVSEEYYKEDRTKSLGIALYSHLLDSNLIEPINLINNVINTSPDLDRIVYLQFLGEHHSISPDLNKVVSLYNNHICIWSSNGDIIKEFPYRDKHICDLGFSSDGSKILECSEKQIKLWDINGNKIWKIETKDNYINHPTFSPNDFFILVYGDNKSLLYNSTGKLLDILPEMLFKYFVFTKDSKNIIIPNKENTIIYNIKTKGRKIINERFVDFSKDQQKLLFQQKNIISIYNKYFQQINTFKTNSISRFNCMFSSKGDKILLLSDTIKLYDLNGALRFSINQFEKYGNKASFSNTDDVFLTYGWNNIAYLWNSNGKLIRKYQNYQSVKFANFINSDQEILTISKDNYIQIRKNDSSMALRYWNKAVNLEVFEIRLSQDETTLFTFNGNNLLKWNLTQKKELLNISGEKFVSCDQSSNFNRILLSTKDNTVTVYDSLGTILKRIKIENERIVKIMNNSRNLVIYCDNKNNPVTKAILYDQDFKLIGSYNSLYLAPVFSSDGKFVLLGKSKAIIIKNIANKDSFKIKKIDNLVSLILSNNNKYILQANFEGYLQIFNTEAKLLYSFKIPTGNIDYVTFSPDNSTILIRLVEDGFHQQELALYKPNGELVRKMIFWDWNSNLPRFTYDSKKVLVSDGNNPKLWEFMKNDYQEGRNSSKLPQSWDIITTEVSPDNNNFAVSYKNNSIHVYNDNGEIISSFYHKSPITFLRFSKDGSLLFVGSINEVKIWCIPNLIMINKLKSKRVLNSIQDIMKNI